MTIKTTTKRFPVFAGMETYLNGGIKSANLRQVGYKIVRFTWQCYPDGDQVLIDEHTIKTIIA